MAASLCNGLPNPLPLAQTQQEHAASQSFPNAGDDAPLSLTKVTKRQKTDLQHPENAYQETVFLDKAASVF
jgi:hypothetical protein